MTIAETMRAKLTAAFAPIQLEIADESERHAGHAGWRPAGETHFRLMIVSEAFARLSRLERHRRIQAVLASELAGGVHALSIEARGPGEPGPSSPSGPG